MRIHIYFFFLHEDRQLNFNFDIACNVLSGYFADIGIGKLGGPGKTRSKERQDILNVQRTQGITFENVYPS